VISGSSVVSSPGLEIPLLAPAVEELDPVQPAVAEQPIGVGGEPVVVAPVEHDGGVLAHPGAGEQALELPLPNELPAQRVVELGPPVPGNRSRDVSLLVQGRVLIHLDHPDPGVPERRGELVGLDEHLLASHPPPPLAGLSPLVIFTLYDRNNPVKRAATEAEVVSPPEIRRRIRPITRRPGRMGKEDSGG
jgi:hypothetical protein